jgi:hypothetical protein
MTEYDYDNGYRAGMQKMRDLTQARIDEMEEALLDMVGLFSADDMLLKGTHLHAALKQARAALQTRRIEAIQRNKLKAELDAARDTYQATCNAAWAVYATVYEAARGVDDIPQVGAATDARAAAFEAARAALDADAFAAYQAELKKQKENSND